MNTLSRLAFGSTVLLSALALGHDGGYSLRWTPKTGDKLFYSTEGTVTIQGTEASLKSKSSWQVINVDADGSYTVQENPIDGSVVFNGQSFPLQKPIVVTLYRPNGEIVSLTGENIEGTSYRAANLSMLKRPDNPVNIGDTWTEDIKPDSKLGSVGMHGTYKLEAAEKVGDVEALKISAVNREVEGTEAGSIEATYWISKTDGSLVKYTAKWSNVTFAGAPAPLSGTMTMTRTAS